MNFGNMMQAAPLSKAACRSGTKSLVRIGLTRIIKIDSPGSGATSTSLRKKVRATSRFSARTASSRSTITASAPDFKAFVIRSGLSAGTKRKVRATDRRVSTSNDLPASVGMIKSKSFLALGGCFRRGLPQSQCRKSLAAQAIRKYCQSFQSDFQVRRRTPPSRRWDPQLRPRRS